jgi:hypothetical protein
MLMIMAVSVTSVVAVRTALKSQYYEQLAKAAGEAGVAYAKACLAKNGNVPLWSDAKPLTPSTDCAGNPLLQPQVQVLVTAGGGGGGGWLGGGGGGGGVIYNNGFPVTPKAYTVTVGGGGSGGASGSTGGSGGNSQFDTLVANGGGGGGGRVTTNSVTQPGAGGSGGGGAGTIDSSTGLPASGSQGIAGQGNDGGSGSSGATAGNGGGGGGASVIGGDASGTASGAGASGTGGNGFLTDISGSVSYYGGGGSGGRYGAGTVGIAGLTGAGMGGNGDGAAGNAAAANTGGGGGGGGSSSAAGGAGGSGVVIIRYPSNGSIVASASNVTPTTEGSYKVFRFTSSGTFTISSTTNSSCPTDPRCSVMSNGSLRSSFNVTAPSLNSEGEAVAIPNTGYVDLLRTSTGTVWRTYKQPSVQAAVVPDFCSGQATSALGWGNAVAATQQDQIVGASSAETIALANQGIDGGRMYFRKDFPVNATDTFTITARTTSLQDDVDVYVDGVLQLSGGGPPTSSNITLDPGCHTVTARLTNETIATKTSALTLAIQKGGGAPIVASDTSWRVSAGSTVHYSQSDYYASPSIWQNAQDMSDAPAMASTWTATTGDSFTRFISAPASTGCGGSCPASSSFYYRDNKDVVVTANTRVRISALCDDNCIVYLDGDPIITGVAWPMIGQQTFTLTPGTHHLAARVSNGGLGQSGIALTLNDVNTGAVYTRTDNRWLSSNIYTDTASAVDVFGYENSFRPSPNDIPEPTTFDVLLAAGGGGGGGNCATCAGGGGGGGGGVIESDGVVAAIGTQTVTIGGGGGGGVGGASRTNGTNGSNTVFGAITATGGGGGGAQLGVAGNNGGSGGGGSGGGSPVAGAGGTGIAGQGSAGGAGMVASPYGSGGGGGATGRGVVGVAAYSGDGGSGYLNYFLGTLMILGSGGGAGAYNTGVAGNGETGVAGSGANQSVNAGVGYAATANRGGGGGGANGSTLGKNGGAGSSGIVIVRYKTGRITATGGTITTANGYTYHTFTGNGSFVISAVN